MSRVLVLFGGRSHEHQISCLSAATVVDALTAAGHTVLTVGITRDGRWTRSAVPIARALELPHVTDGPTCVLASLTTGVILRTFAPDETTVAADEPVDVVFPVMHGAGGEDGTIQGFLETVGVPYVGADVAASTLGVNKIAMKQRFAAAGLPQVPFVPLTHQQFIADPAGAVVTVTTTVNAPWFVKPAREGSSFGITRVTNANALHEAITHAFTFGPDVIVEEGADGARELEVGVLGDTTPVVTGPGEIVSAHTFYDFDAKYRTTSTLHIPADVPAEQAATIKQLAVAAYQAIGCQGLARVDFFLHGDTLLVNEINTIPGFTAHSMFPLLWAHEGKPFAQLVDELVNDALHR